jgi:hypothetical protein
MAPKSKKKKKVTSKKKGKDQEESEDVAENEEKEVVADAEGEDSEDGDESEGEDSEDGDSEDGDEADKKDGDSDASSADDDKPKARKPGAPKEVIAFQWKVVGRSGDLNLVLFKCVERADADREYQRLLAEGYYGNLGVHPVKAAIPSNVGEDEPAKTKTSKKKSKKK